MCQQGGARLRLRILNIGEEPDREITGLYGLTRLRLAVGGAKQLCESLWPDSNDSGTLRLIRYKRNYIKVEMYISESGILNI